MKYSILVTGTDVCYIHQSGHTKERAEYIANTLNNAMLNDNGERIDDGDFQAIVMADEEARQIVTESSDTSYFAVLEDGNVVLIEITPEMEKTIEDEYNRDYEGYFYEVICEDYNISHNNCQWMITSESCITCYGKKPNITL